MVYGAFPPQDFFDHLIGKTEEEATKVIKDLGYVAQVTHRDGVDFIITMELRNNRACLSVVLGIVTNVKMG